MIRADAEFFGQLARQRLVNRLSFFALSAGEFPEAGERAGIKPTANEHGLIAKDDSEDDLDSPHSPFVRAGRSGRQQIFDATACAERVGSPPEKKDLKIL